MTLTDEQLSVVNLVSGRHLVLAPPGSGKTEMLSQRILRALASGVDPKKMLCATFTNRAAFEMRDRVSGAAGPDCALPDVGNLHHFCRRFLLSVRRIHPGKHVLDESQQLDFIREVTDVLREELREGMTADLKKAHGVSVETSIGCLQNACVYDSEAIEYVRQAAHASRKERDHRTALEYFKSGHQGAPERQRELRAAIGDFVYHRTGTLRLDAATFLAAQGITRWNGIVRGASTDFVRLQSVADDEHEETIRAILVKKNLPDEYERRLRMIIFARAKRNPKV